MGDNTQLDDWYLEQQEWLEAMEEVLEEHGKGRTEELFQRLRYMLARKGVANGGIALNTAFQNTIPLEDEAPYPGDLKIEKRIEQVLRWNAQAMVLQAQDKHLALGGHIASYASCATMIEVLYHNFLRKRTAEYGGDLFMFQGHAAPGVYARAVWLGRMPLERIRNFRQELLGGVSSYPHPRRMPDFWQAPTVSMGLGPMTAIYQARYMKYLESRGLKPQNGGKVWHIIGDGEIDEPEILGTISVASRENLDNLIFIVNCNLQRLDGPVRGNGKIIQELERHFLGAGWDVIKVLWGSNWDPIFARDTDGVLQRRLEALVDGDYQEMVSMDGTSVRKKLVGDDPRIAEILSETSDEMMQKLRRGGHCYEKMYAAITKAYSAGKPVVILAHTVKGYGLGKAGEGKNKAHQTKDLSAESRIETKNRYEIPISDEDAVAAKFWFPAPDDPVTQYMDAKRKALGGYLPARSDEYPRFALPELTLFDKQLKGSAAAGGKSFSTTAAVVDIMTQLIRNPELGKYIVPIVPDEAQTFGMEPLFNSVQIWNQKGQLYEPLEIGISVIKYKESKTGQVLQEGINEDGATASFTAAGTAYALHGIPTVPFFILYSMFGFQRVGDVIWAAADMMCKGFILGATAGRTTLNGEGLQHQDGHSQLLALTVPSVVSYDPAFAYELAVIVHDGIRRMYVENESKLYYITVYNENLLMPPMPANVEEGIKRGLYKFRQSESKSAKAGVKAHLIGSGVIMDQVLQAAEILESEGVSTDIWSATSWNELYRDALACDRRNLLHPGEAEQMPYVQQAFKGEEGVFVAASDWMKITPGALQKWMPANFTALGTDGFGLSESRESLRNYFEISAIYIAFAAVRALEKEGKVSGKAVLDFMKKYKIDADKPDPMDV